jgi:hypothetical protein
MFSFDLQDGVYALGINPMDRGHFIDFRGHLYRFTGLPMGWSLSLFYFLKMTLTFVNFLRAPDPELLISPRGKCTKTYLETTRWHGAMFLPYVDDFILFPSTEKEALTLRQRLAKVFGHLGLLRDPTKGF